MPTVRSATWRATGCGSWSPFLRLAYKADVDDLRESPLLGIVEHAAKEGNGELIMVEPNMTELPPALGIMRAR
jgi:UDP-N-acetyl-D-mannosaminuronic acid dehydrogenase